MAFHPYYTREYGDSAIRKALSAGYITPGEIVLIQQYIDEIEAERHISEGRRLKILYHLIHWRRFITQGYSSATYADITKGISELKNGKNLKGRPFSQNTQHDYVRVLKSFLMWMADNDKTEIPEKQIRKLSPPQKNLQTTEPDEILTTDEVTALLNACLSPRDKALIAIMYESGARIGEIARLCWRDLVRDDYGYKMYILDKKTRKRRYSRLTMSTGHINAYKNAYPGSPEGNSLVFVTLHAGRSNKTPGRPLEYSVVNAMLQRVASKARIDKRIHAHLFRKSRITHMIEQNYQESVIKETMWGNAATSMMRTYVVLSEKSIDAEMLDKAGVAEKEITLEKPLLQITCGNCHEVNSPGNDYCFKCAAPLSEKAIAAQQHEIDDLLEDARNSQIFDYISKKQEEMKKEILAEIMKNR